MILITELLALNEDAASSKDATFHVDTPRLRVIEAKTKHAVKFFNDVYFDKEDYKPFKYGTKCYYVIRETEGTGYFKVIRINFDSKQFVGLEDKDITPQELRGLCEGYPELYDIFEADAKKNGVLSAVKYDEIDAGLIEKKIASLIKTVHGRKGRVDQVMDSYEFKRWFSSTFGFHKLSSKLQDAFLAAAKKYHVGSTFFDSDVVKAFDAHHVTSFIIEATPSRDVSLTTHLMDIIKDDKAEMKRLISYFFDGLKTDGYSTDSEWSGAAARVVGSDNHNLDLSEYISPELAAKIGAFAGLDWLRKLKVKLDDELAAKIIDLNPKRVAGMEVDYKHLVTNKLKERARLAIMALARKS